MENVILFNKSDYTILELLYNLECNTPIQSLTVKQIISNTKLSATKTRAVIKSFLMVNYISEGSKEGNNKTYYITKIGEEHYEKTFGIVNDEQIIEENYENE